MNVNVLRAALACILAAVTCAMLALKFELLYFWIIAGLWIVSAVAVAVIGAVIEND